MAEYIPSISIVIFMVWAGIFIGIGSKEDRR